MKSLFVIAFAMTLSIQLFGQSADQRLFDHFSEEELSTLMKDNPSEIRILNYALDNGLYVTDHASSKAIVPSIEVDPDNLPNFLELGLMISDQNQYFNIKGQDKMLVLKSRWVLNNELSKQD